MNYVNWLYVIHTKWAFCVHSSTIRRSDNFDSVDCKYVNVNLTVSTLDQECSHNYHEYWPSQYNIEAVKLQYNVNWCAVSPKTIHRNPVLTIFDLCCCFKCCYNTCTTYEYVFDRPSTQITPEHTIEWLAAPQAVRWANITIPNGIYTQIHGCVTWDAMAVSLTHSGRLPLNRMDFYWIYV